VSETQRFLLLAILIGIFAGLLVVFFHIAIDSLSWFALHSPTGVGPLATLLWPAFGAAAASAIVLYWFPAARGSGVNHTKAAIYVSDGNVPFSSVIGKFLACSISIGTGNSLGPEDPSLQMGAGVASLLGRTFRLSRETMRQIAPVGAAAGIAAAFNTPITAVLFVIEEIVAGWRASVLGSIVLSAVAAVVVVRSFLGDSPLFEVPPFRLTHPSELLIYAAIGVIGGLLAAGWIGAMRWLHQWNRHTSGWRRLLPPFAAGLVVGAIGIGVPQIMGAGYEAVESALHQQFPWYLLAILTVAKMAATAGCFASGTPGGMFAPTLFTGAMLGGAIGALGRQVWPVPVSSPDAYVLVGMGTFFAGVFRAPMTSIFMVFEVSASYVIILPVMISNTVAYLISRRLQPVAFFDMVARQEGIDLPSHEEQRERPAARVEDAMASPAVPYVARMDSIASVYARLRQHGSTYSLVDFHDGRWAFVRELDLEKAMRDSGESAPLGQAVDLMPIPRLYPDLSLDSALRLMGPHALLPVVSRRHPDRLLGTLSIEDVYRLYGLGNREPEPPPRSLDAAAGVAREEPV
jgi:CIC family chloride channel protein